jgi:proteasome accessory factor B
LGETDALEDEGTWNLEGDEKAERLLSLALTLIGNKSGFTKEELMGSIRGYHNAIAAGKKTDALNKLFERDKASLRELGIQVETFIRDSDLEDNTESRYFIPSNSFVWPKNVKLSANQLRLLELAAKVWARASFSVDAQRAVTRLKALGMPSDGLDLSGFAPRIMTSEPGFLQLEEAARDGIEVSFDYRAPDAEVVKRTVQPWQLRNISGQWMLVCWDSDRQDIRNFLLKRIVSKITATGNGFAVATNSQVDQAGKLLEDHINKNVAVITVRPGTEAWVHFDLDAPGALNNGQFIFNFMDVHLLAEELRQYGSNVQVVSPETLKAAVRRGFEKVADLHA